MLRDFAGYGEHPPLVDWPNGARLAVSVGINYEEGAEQSMLDDGAHENVGEVLSSVPPERRDVWVESFFEYGSRVGVWRLLNIVGEHDILTTFFLCGRAGERNPAVAKAIVERGHEPCGHGYLWQDFHNLSDEQQLADIRKCVETIKQLTGERPVGWLNRYAPSPATREILAAEGGFIYDNNAYNDDLPYYVPVGAEKRPWLILPYSMELNDARCWRGAMLSVREYEDFLIEAFDRLYAESKTAPKMMSIGLHCRISGTPGRAGVLDRFIKHAKKHDVWFARRDHIARWWLEKYPAESFAKNGSRLWAQKAATL